MRLDPGKYIVETGDRGFGKVEYWMIYHHNGQKKICVNQGYPQVIKNDEDKVFMDDGVRILKQLDLKQSIEMVKADIELRTVDVFENHATFTMKNLAVLERLQVKFPSIRKLIDV